MKLSGAYGTPLADALLLSENYGTGNGNPGTLPRKIPIIITGGEAYEKNEFPELWKMLEDRYEDRMDFPLRQPVLWMK
ncbi:MAG: hypothetical protein U5N56_00285 [Candidatus Marinimicrobia bacterium]|nr:hypothetical protein [Candidatus Neomarinimicrobiota bacterium]